MGRVVKSILVSLGTVVLTLMLKTVELSITREASFEQIASIQYELLIISLSASAGGYAAAPAANKHLFYKPLFGVAMIIVAVFFLFALVSLLPMWPHWVDVGVTILVPDALGFGALGWTVLTIGKARP